MTTLPEVVTPGKWQHVAFVRKEDEVAIYHNGQPVAQGIVKQLKLEEGKDPEVKCNIFFHFWGNGCAPDRNAPANPPNMYIKY
ncbi:MAG: hypothetical protein HY360_06465 [Verrucomicrobia bacterium]|nr:hypothetical protein [Verrucomicrobiota bacterium]